MKHIDDILKEVKKVHFIGIGGAGMCPLAEILISLGYEVTGSDNNDTETFRRVENEGAKVFLGQKKRKHFAGHTACYLHKRNFKRQRGA